MENMSEATSATAERRDSLAMSDNSDDIIDLSAMDFSDNDTWLQRSSLDTADDRICDLYTWLRSDVERDCDDSTDNRRAVDTRTFTRPKKRCGRLSFEPETGRPRTPNVWGRGSPCSRQEAESTEISTRPESETIPHMLRSSISSAISGHPSLNSAPGHESLEAFLNMSRSKGIDSFIDLAEPEFSDDIMDVSQPSVLYSSVLSVATEDNSQNCSMVLNQSLATTRQGPGIEDSQILTESMMQTSMFGDVVDVNFNDTFAKNSANVTVLENADYAESMDATFVALVDGDATTMIEKAFEAPGKMDATYTPSRLVNASLTSDPHASYIVERSPGSELFKIPSFNDASYLVTENSPRPSSLLNNVAPDASFVIARALPAGKEDSTFITIKSPGILARNDTFDVAKLDVTFETTANPSGKCTDASVPSSAVIRTSDKVAAEDKIDGSLDDDTLEDPEATFCKARSNAPRPDETRIRTTGCDETVRVEIPSETVTGFRTETPENGSREDTERSKTLESSRSRDCQDTRIGRARPSTKTNVPRSRLNSENVPKNSSPAGVSRPNDTSEVRNFDATFEKSRPSPPKKSPTSAEMNETFKAPLGIVPRQRNVEVTGGHTGSLDNLDTKHDKIPPRLTNPSSRQLSRLPQSFQKSNPNLVSNALKYAPATATNRSAIPSFGYNRPRPSLSRNPDSLHFGGGKLLVLGKAKSGSEQRLDVTRNVPEITMSGGSGGGGGSGGSTESIDSTQSAHSAPDFDDRLSVRSDGSNTSYSVRAMNIEEFQKIVRLRDECLKQESTPKPSRRVMENNWVTAPNDLPSPIMKIGAENYGSRGSSPRSTDSMVKTSSPLLSPTESLQNLPIDGVESNKNSIDENKFTIARTKSNAVKKNTQASIKPPQKNTTGEHRTGLRPPASWTSTNRPASGIPRPASRIPGPRFARPNAKINYGDTRK